MLMQRSSLFCAVFSTLVLGLATVSNAATIDVLATPFTGTDATVRITLTEQGGDILVTAAMERGLGDLRGIFLDIVDDTLLAGLSVSGEFVTGFSVGDVIDLGQGSNVHGGGTPCPCDIGVEIGTPGIGKDDIGSTSFLISSAAGPLSLSEFSEQWVGVRITSVGPDPYSRGGSAKLAGQLPEVLVPVPEPASAFLLAIGLGALGYTARMRR
jgi:PEP-CTERM motif